MTLSKLDGKAGWTMRLNTGVSDGVGVRRTGEALRVWHYANERFPDTASDTLPLEGEMTLNLNTGLNLVADGSEKRLAAFCDFGPRQH